MPKANIYYDESASGTPKLGNAQFYYGFITRKNE